LRFGVVLTVYNQTAHEIKCCINSVRSSTLEIDEIIIYDDGSTREETLAFLNTINLKDNERFIRKPNAGVVYARNRAAEYIESDYILFIDPDDELDINFVERAKEAIQNSRNIDIVYSNVRVKTEKGDRLEDWKTGPFNPFMLRYLNTIPMTSLVRLSIFRELQGFSPEFESGFEDWDFWYRCSLSGVKAKKVEGYAHVYTKKLISRSSSMKDNSLKLRDRWSGIFV